MLWISGNRWTLLFDHRIAKERKNLRTELRQFSLSDAFDHAQLISRLWALPHNLLENTVMQNDVRRNFEYHGFLVAPAFQQHDHIRVLRTIAGRAGDLLVSFNLPRMSKSGEGNH